MEGGARERERERACRGRGRSKASEARERGCLVEGGARKREEAGWKPSRRGRRLVLVAW